MAADLPSISGVLRVWAAPPGPGAGELVPGRDVVLHAARPAVDGLARGVLLDDWLDQRQREQIDASARVRLARWRRDRDALLTAAGAPLAYVHELELFADVFLRESRVVGGLEALAGRGAARMELRGLDPELAACLTETLGEAGATAEVHAPGAPPRYPLTFPGRARRTGAGALREAVGLPGWPRGRVFVEPYWNLQPVWSRLASQEATIPLLNPVNRPRVPAGSLARLAARGGWMGSPGWRSRRASALACSAALERLRGAAAEGGLERLFDLRAARLLESVAEATACQVDARRRAFARARLGAVLTYSDTAPQPRMSVVAARDAGAAVVCVQHGLFAYVPTDAEGRPARELDGWEADAFGVWARRDEELFARHLPGRVQVTGNPGARAPVPADQPTDAPRRALVLGQMPSPLSTGADARVTSVHLHAALSALEAERPGTEVLVRPHPLDLAHAAYERIARDHPDVEVTVSARGSVEEAIEACDLCVGAPSTATLQAAAMGRSSVLLDVTGFRLSWPFDGSGAFPAAGDAGELRGLIAGPASAGDGRDEAIEALGTRRDSAERVAALVREALR